MLIECDECGGKVSERAVACPSCGNPRSFLGDAPQTSSLGAAILQRDKLKAELEAQQKLSSETQPVLATLKMIGFLLVVTAALSAVTKGHVFIGGPYLLIPVGATFFFQRFLKRAFEDKVKALSRELRELEAAIIGGESSNATE